MIAKLKSRLEELEEIAQQRRQRMNNAIFEGAFAALSDGDLKSLKQFCERLARGSALQEAIADCTPEERVAIQRFNTVGEEAAPRMEGR
jgi:hypothetical protein